MLTFVMFAESFLVSQFLEILFLGGNWRSVLRGGGVEGERLSIKNYTYTLIS